MKTLCRILKNYHINLKILCQKQLQSFSLNDMTSRWGINIPFLHLKERTKNLIRLPQTTKLEHMMAG